MPAQGQAALAKQVAKAAYLSIDPTRQDDTFLTVHTHSRQS